MNQPFAIAKENVRPALIEVAEKVCHEIARLPRGRQRRIHDIRVLLKRFRALLRLVCGQLPPRTFRQMDRMAKEIKNAFGNERDQQVLADLVRKMWETPEAARLLRALGLRKVSTKTASGIVALREAMTRKAADLLQKIGGAGGRDRALLARPDAVGASAAAAAQALLLCANGEADDAQFHRWRRKLKTLIYQTEYLDARAATSLRLKRLKKLAHLLGAHHDLAVLEFRMQTMAVDKPPLRRVARAKGSVARAALKLGSQLFPGS